MMLQVKNFSKMILCTLLLLAAGCTDSNSNEPKTLYGSVTRPEWSAPDNYDYTSSMTVVAKIDLKAGYPKAAADFEVQDNDLLAAFDGDKCLGVAGPQEGLFLLYIAGTEGSVTLRYYSALYKNIFAAEPIAFQTDAILGTVAAPYSPAWVLAE